MKGFIFLSNSFSNDISVPLIWKWSKVLIYPCFALVIGTRRAPATDVNYERKALFLGTSQVCSNPWPSWVTKGSERLKKFLNSIRRNSWKRTLPQCKMSENGWEFIFLFFKDGRCLPTIWGKCDSKRCRDFWSRREHVVCPMMLLCQRSFALGQGWSLDSYKVEFEIQNFS